jgi:hypothetical protein
MAFPDDIFLPDDDRCEICGAKLADEVIIQEFADGSIARLCSECAAGAALQAETAEFRFPESDLPDEGAEEAVPDDQTGFDEPPRASAAPAADAAAPAPAAADAAAPAPAGIAGTASTAAPAATAQAGIDPDILEKTRELLTPVVDLLTLQRDMQGALQRLATSLQTFATGVMSDNVDKTASVESRLEALEQELEATRARLRDAESRLAAAPSGTTTPAAAAAQPIAATPPVAAAQPAGAAGPAAAAASQDTIAQAPAAAAASFWDFESTMETTAESTGEYLVPEPTGAGAPAATPPRGPDTATQPYSLPDLESTLPPIAPPVVPPPVAPPAGPPTAEHHNRPVFSLLEVQIAQKHFNESHFTNRIRDVRKSLGKPRANLTKLIGDEPRAVLTIAWDIIWYQYMIELRRDTPSDQRVSLHREGMDLDELTSAFKDKNSSVDDEGRLDASELEVKLLSDPSTLITEMSMEEERALEDATEEIWDQKTAPEFKWDD